MSPLPPLLHDRSGHVPFYITYRFRVAEAQVAVEMAAMLRQEAITIGYKIEVVAGSYSISGLEGVTHYGQIKFVFEPTQGLDASLRSTANFLSSCGVCISDVQISTPARLNELFCRQVVPHPQSNRTDCNSLGA